MDKRKQDAHSFEMNSSETQSSETKSSNRIHVQLTNLRQKLEQFLGTPIVDNHPFDLAHLRDKNSIFFEDDSMLTVVLSDALKGVDIFQTYPNFCQRLAKEPALFDLFSDALTMMQPPDVPEPAAIATTTSKELDFLQKKPAQVPPVIQRQTGQQWSVRWQQTITKLEMLLLRAESGFTPVTRRLDATSEVHQLDLISSDFVVDDIQLKVVLQAAQMAADPSKLQLSLWAFVADFEQALETRLSLEARLRWGDYNKTVAIPSETGQATFPLVPLDQILNAAQTQVTAELHLTLTSSP